MKDSRVGEHLWFEWDGDLYDSSDEDPTVYYTYGHIDVDIDVVKRALASTLQRDGIVSSLSEGFKVVELAKVTHLWVGSDDPSLVETVCDIDGETYYGDVFSEPLDVTFVEILI